MQGVLMPSGQLLHQQHPSTQRQMQIAMKPCVFHCREASCFVRAARAGLDRSSMARRVSHGALERNLLQPLPTWTGLHVCQQSTTPRAAATCRRNFTNQTRSCASYRQAQHAAHVMLVLQSAYTPTSLEVDQLLHSCHLECLHHQ